MLLYDPTLDSLNLSIYQSMDEYVYLTTAGEARGMLWGAQLGFG